MSWLFFSCNHSINGRYLSYISKDRNKQIIIFMEGNKPPPRFRTVIHGRNQWCGTQKTHIRCGSAHRSRILTAGRWCRRGRRGQRWRRTSASKCPPWWRRCRRRRTVWTRGGHAGGGREGGKNPQHTGSEEIGKDRARSGDDEARRLRPSPPFRAARKQEVVKYNRIF